MGKFVEAIASVPVLRRGGSVITRQLKRMSVDVGVAGFPKCGNTWTSALLRQLILEHYGVDANNFSRLFVSDLGALPMTFLQLPAGIPRIYQTHFMPLPVRPDLSGIGEGLAPFRGKRMMILVRDWKDALVSYFLWNVRRFGVEDAPTTIGEFVHSPKYGIEKYVGYYNLIAESRSGSCARTRIVSYEQRWDDPVGTLEEDAKFLNIDVARDVLARIVEQYDFDHMRQIEMATTKETAILTPLYRVANEHQDARFVRKGGSGNWREHMSPSLAAELDAYVAAHLDPTIRASLP